MPRINVTNNTLIVSQLRGVFGQRVPVTGAEDINAWLRGLDDIGGLTELPFKWSYVVPVYERIQVLSAVFSPQKKELLHNYLDENCDRILLCTDCIQSGRNGLYFVATISHPSVILQWMKCMRDPCMIVKRRPRSEDILIAAPVSAFA